MMKLTASVLTLALALSPSVLAGQQQTTTKPKPTTQKPPVTTQKKPPVKAPAKPAAAKPDAPKPEPPKPEPPKPATDVRVKTAYTQGPQISENVTYIQGDRQRVEFPGVVTINQCDLHRTVMLNTAAKRYRVQEHPAAAATTPAPAPAASSDPNAQMSQMGMMGAGAPQPRGGVITMTTTFTDTLERQQLYGLEARHVKTTVTKQASDKACDKAPLKVEIDAWYVDLPSTSACTIPTAPPPSAPPVADEKACTDRVDARTVGSAKLGFPVKSTTTTTTGEGDKLEVTSVSQDVTELEITRLDRALFDVPPDFVEATSTAEIVPAIATGGSLSDALFGSTADGTSIAAPKKAGAIRIGVLEPINRTDRKFPASFMRQDLAGKFTKAPFEAIAVAGSSPAGVMQDAARLQCDYLLLAEIVEAKTSKPGKITGAMKKVSGDSAKDSHEVKLEYKLFAVTDTSKPKATGSAKASNGGFGVGSALRLAAFAGQMYFTMGMMGGMGFMNQMSFMSSTGMGAMGGGLFDPRSAAMSSMAMGFDGGASFGDMSNDELRQTVSEAFGNAAKSVIEQIKKK